MQEEGMKRQGTAKSGINILQIILVYYPNIIPYFAFDFKNYFRIKSRFNKLKLLSLSSLAIESI